MNIGFLGFGNMASAMAEGLLFKKALPREQIGAYDINTEKLRSMCDGYGIRAFDSAEAMLDFADCVVIAVKPYLVAEVLKPLRDKLQDKMIVSVAAGLHFDDIEAIIPGTRHISTGPNLPIAVGEGVFACEQKHSLNEADLKFLEESIGKAALIEFMPSNLIGVSGSFAGCGPAYVAMFAEAWADAGVKHGLSRDQAKRLAAKMIQGSAGLLLHKFDPAELKDKVCSPGGTTIRGVAALEQNGFRGALIAALDAVENR